MKYPLVPSRSYRWDKLPEHLSHLSGTTKLASGVAQWPQEGWIHSPFLNHCAMPALNLTEQVAQGSESAKC